MSVKIQKTVMTDDKLEILIADHADITKAATWIHFAVPMSANLRQPYAKSLREALLWLKGEAEKQSDLLLDKPNPAS